LPTAPSNDLDALVRRFDEDRWLASRFAPDGVRSRLIALYAVNHEIAHAAETVRQAAIGDIRLAWWREALAEVHEGKAPRAQPALLAYAEALRDTPWPREAWDALIEARSRDLDGTAFADWSAVDAYVDATAGAMMRLGFTACGVAPEPHRAFIDAASRAWGAIGLARAGRALPGEAIERAMDAHRVAREHARGVPAGAFPAFGYIALSPRYARALRKGERKLGLFGRQMALVGAAATGRV
jgi:phytoene synthase